MSTNSRHIVILGEEDDPHTNLVMAHLATEPLIINAGKYTQGLAYEFGPDIWPTITYAGEHIDLGPDTIKSVWYRHLGIPRLRPDLEVHPPEERESTVSAMQHMADALPTFFHPETFWISDQEAVIRAEHKPNQLAHARQAGLRVPRTLCTSDAQRAKRFVGQEGSCIVKPMATRAPNGHRQYAVVWDGTQLDLKELDVNPRIFQQPIDPDVEARVAVLGFKTFASEVSDSDEQSSAEQGIRDFRHALVKGTLETEALRLPREVLDACIALVRRLGLVCAFIDLIRDKNGTWWFIDLNVSGWAFLDSETTRKIAQTLAGLLESARSPWVFARM